MTSNTKFKIPNAKSFRKKFALFAVLAVFVMGLAPQNAKAAASVTVSFRNPNPDPAALGGTIEICLTDTSAPGATFLSGNGNLTVNGTTLGGAQSIPVSPITGQGCKIFALTTANSFREGPNSITADISYFPNSPTGNTGIITNTTAQPASLTLASASASPRVSIVVGSITGGTAIGFTVTLNFNFSGQPPPTSYQFDCGEGSGAPRTGTVSATATSFTCNYTEASAGGSLNRTFHVTVTAVNSAYTTPVTASVDFNPVTVSEQGIIGGSGAGDKIGGVLISIVNIVIGVITGLARWVVWLLTTLIALPLLKASMQIRAADIADFITVGWQFVRDVVNMLFIIVLIIIGFGTMLRIESYNYKKLLVNLIVMAMLVNFSLVIGRIIIQLADVAQFTFLPSDSVAIENLYKNLAAVQIDAILAGFRAMSITTGGALGGTFALLFQFAFELALALTFIALAIFAMIRNIALWILLILSPFAYALAILPTTAGLAKKWWSEFIKYVLFLPLIAFFLRLTEELYLNGLKIFPATSPLGNTFGSSCGDFICFMNTMKAQWDLNPNAEGTLGSAMLIATVFLVVLAFLWAGMIITRQMGIFGAGAIVGLAERGLKAPFAGGAWLGKRGIGFAGQKWNEWTSKLVHEKAGAGRKALFALVNPVAFARGWQERSKERKEEARAIASGAGREVASGMWTRGREKLPYKELAKMRTEREYVKKLRDAMGEDMDKSQAKDFFHRIQDVKGQEGELLRGAYDKIVTAQGYLDDKTEVVAADLKVKLDKGEFSHLGADIENMLREATTKYNDKTLQTMQWYTSGLDLGTLWKLRNVKDYKETDEYKSWRDKEDTQDKLRRLADLSSSAKDIGHFEQMYMAVKDETTHMYEALADAEWTGATEADMKRTAMIKGEMVKIPIRDLMRKITWHNLLPKEAVIDATGQIVDWKPGRMVDEKGKSLLTEYQRTMLETLGPEYIGQATHVQPRTVKYTVGQWVNEDGSIKDPQQFAAMRKVNAGLADVLKNVAVYGRPDPLPKDLDRVDTKSREIHVRKIITDEGLDERAAIPIEHAYKETYEGRMTTADATSHMTSEGIPPAIAAKIVDDINEALAARQSGLIAPVSYLPRAVANTIGTNPKAVKDLSEAVKKGIEEGLKGQKFGDASTIPNLEFHIRRNIDLTLTPLGVSAADLDSIAKSMAEKANQKPELKSKES